MDDRTRTQTGTDAPLLAEHPYNSMDFAGLVFGTAMAVLLGTLLVAGLGTAIGTWPAVIVATLTFAGLLWKLVPTAESTATRRVSVVRRIVHRGIVVGCLGGVCGIAMSALPGCAESQANVAAHQALQTNNDILAPFTLRGIDDAEEAYPGEDGISPALAAQYRGLVDDNGQLIDTLNGRPADGAGVAVEPERDTP